MQAVGDRKALFCWLVSLECSNLSAPHLWKMLVSHAKAQTVPDFAMGTLAPFMRVTLSKISRSSSSEYLSQSSRAGRHMVQLPGEDFGAPRNPGTARKCRRGQEYA